jgi:hypothetical protein
MSYIPDFSYEDHLVYKIKKGDTLQKVADQLGVDSYSLRAFHNMRCPLDDLIEADFKSHLKFIIIESEKSKVAREAHRESVHFANNFKLPFTPQGLDSNYLAEYTIENGDQQHNIKEEINVRWINKDKNDFSLIEINRISQVYVDGKETDIMADELAEKTARVFYPLQVVIDPNGELVAIYNFEDIRDRWLKIKKEILKDFQGEVLENALLQFENKLQNNEIIFDSLSKDWFLKVFFNSLNIEYTEKLAVQREIEFPLTQKTGNVLFTVEQSILPQVDAYNLINVTQNGILSDARSKNDFENDLLFPDDNPENENPEKANGSYTAYYFLDPSTHVPESIYLECEIKLDIPQKITVVISNLKSEAKLSLSSDYSFLVEEKEEKKSNIFKLFLEVIKGK